MSTSYTFSTFNENCSQGISQALYNIVPIDMPLVFMCIGSDLVLGDSLGPLVGTFLKKKNVGSFVYGSLSFPITAKEVEIARKYLTKTHPNSCIIAIDAAIGNEDDVGLIRVVKQGLKPGLGVNKNLGTVGNISVIGVVAGKSVNNHNLFNLTRLNLIYNMAKNVSDGIEQFLNNKNKIIEQNQRVFGT